MGAILAGALRDAAGDLAALLAVAATCLATLALRPPAAASRSASGERSRLPA